MKENEKDPTAGWAWNPEMQCFMQPSLCFDGRWKVADIPWEKAQDPAYRYDPARHPLYEDALRQQDVQIEAKKRAEPVVQQPVGQELRHQIACRGDRTIAAKPYAVRLFRRQNIYHSAGRRAYGLSGIISGLFRKKRCEPEVRLFARTATNG